MAIYPIPPNPLLGGIASGGGAAGVQQWPSQTHPIIKTEDDKFFDMLCSRMRWLDSDPYRLVPTPQPPFQRISAHKLNDTTAVVFIIQNGKAVLIEDGLDLFPSDTLITQLRLLAEPK